MVTVFHKNFAIFGATALALLFIGFALVAGAQESSVTFPVSELGNCSSKMDCHAYCDDLSHVKECIAFAESHGLMSEQEAKVAKGFAQLSGKGPGGCTSKKSCETYCEDPTHMRQCLTFAKDTGIMDEQELREAEKVALYLEQGGAMPGGCRGEQQCKAYCENGEHAEECMQFALKAGFMSEKEAEIFKKTGGKGPGGCRGNECKTFCDNGANREQCVTFALEHNLMSEEERKHMEEGREKAMDALQKAPPGVLSCIEATLGAEKVTQLKNGEGFAGPQLGEVFPRCMREVMGDGSKGPFGPGSAASDCMRKIFGEDFEEKMSHGDLDPGARDAEIRECMQAQMGEGFLNDRGAWERPQGGPAHGDGGMPSSSQQNEVSDDIRRSFKRPHERSNEVNGDMRAQMEERMRKEIESQMKSGNFDRSKLPRDFAPEGRFAPPEALNRPPEHMSPDGREAEWNRQQNSTQPEPEHVEPTEMQSARPPEESSGPTSMATVYLANTLSVLLYLLNIR